MKKQNNYIKNFAKTYVKIYEANYNDVIITDHNDIKRWIIFEDKKFLDILNDLEKSAKSLDNKLKSTTEATLTEFNGPGMITSEVIHTLSAIEKSVDPSTGEINSSELEKNINNGTIAGSVQNTVENTGMTIMELADTVISLLKYGFTIGMIAAVIITIINNSDKIMKVLNGIGGFLTTIAEKLFNNDIQIATLELTTTEADYILSFDISDFEWELRYNGFKSYYSKPDNEEMQRLCNTKVVKDFFKYCEDATNNFYKNDNFPIILKVISNTPSIDKKYKRIFEAIVNNKKDIINNMIDPAKITFVD